MIYSYSLLLLLSIVVSSFVSSLIRSFLVSFPIKKKHYSIILYFFICYYEENFLCLSLSIFILLSSSFFISIWPYVFLSLRFSLQIDYSDLLHLCLHVRSIAILSPYVLFSFIHLSLSALFYLCSLSLPAFLSLYTFFSLSLPALPFFDYFLSALFSL